jgi:hypothetical protein
MDTILLDENKTFVPAFTDEKGSKSVLLPNSKTRLAADRPITKKDIDNLKGGKSVLYVFGKIIYEDVFSHKEHHTTFCQYMWPNLTTMVNCSKYNDAD